MHNIRINQVYPTTLRSNASLVLLPVLGVIVTTTGASAQVVPSNSSTTVVDITSDRTNADTPVQLDITGGQLSNDEANLFHGFEQFDITAEQTANFVTTPEVHNVIGRVSSDRASSINGTLQVSGSDANLYLMNPAGILTGPDAQLNLSGGFTATTSTGIEFENGQFAAIENGDVNDLTGAPTGFRFDAQQVGAVVNLGDLSIEDGEALTLVGGTVVNTGSLSAPSGTVTMAAVEGESTVRISQGDQLLSLEVEANQPETSAYSTITPDSIAEMLTGGDFSDATALVTNADGTVNLSGGQTVTSETGEKAISERGGTAIASGTVSTLGETGGNINVLGNQVLIQEAVLDASGDYGGGFIRVGGDYKGQGAVVNASQTLINEGSSLQADAIDHGNGGRIIVWADDATHYSGQISAQGGFSSGNGGFAEVSGKTNLSFDGSVNLSASQGEFGTLLIDPRHIEITDGTQSGTANTTYFTSTMVEDLLNMNVVFEATHDITIHDISNNDLRVNKGQSITFTADSDGVAGGDFRMGLGDTIRAEQGNVTITGAGIVVGTIDTSTDEHNAGGASGIVGGDVTLNSSQGVTASEILTYGFLTSTPHHAPDGGNVSISALNGDIDIEQSIQTFSAVDGEEAGSAGNITLTAQGNISVSTANPTTNSVLLASSQAQTHESGNGGIISLTAITGNIDIAGHIASESRAEGNDNGDSNAGNGGNIFLDAEGDILTGTILTSSIANGDRAGNGGDINISSGAGLASIGDIENFSTATGSDSGNAGRLNITANNITTGSIDTSSNATNNAGDAGSVILTSSDELLANGINATSNGGGNNADVTLTGDRTDVTNNGLASISGENVRFQAATNSKDIIIGGNVRSLTDITLLESDLAALNNISLLTIGQADSNNTITLKESLNGSLGSRPPINIVGGESIIGPDNTDNIFQITDIGSGSLTNTDVAFSNIENLVGGNQNDSFEFIDNGSLLGSIDGASGIDSLDYSNTVTTPIQIDLENMSTTGVSAFTNIENIIGSSANSDRILGTIANNTFVVTGSSSGRANETLMFSSIEELSGNTGSDTLSYEEYGSAIIVDINNMSATDVSSFSNIETVIGSSANDDKIIGSAGNNNFEITDNGAGNINNALTFSAIEVLEGNSGNDTLDYSNYNSKIEVDLDINRATGIAEFSEIEEIVGSPANNDKISGSAGNDTFNITGADSGLINNRLSFSSIEDLEGAGGINTLSLNDIEPGSDRTWLIDGLNRGTVNELTFDNFSMLIGSTGQDTFALTEEGLITGAIDANEGADTLDYSGYEEEFSIDIGSRTATGITTFNSIEEIVGNQFTESVIEGSTNDDTFVITGDGSGRLNDMLTFSNISKIDGQGGNNTLTVASPTTSIPNNWVIDGDNRGSINNLPFERIRNITGGDTNDTFSFIGSGHLEGTVTGGDGIDTVDYSQYASPISVNLSTMSTTSGSTLLSTFSGIEAIEGTGADTDQIIGTATNDIFEITDSGRGSVNDDIAFSEIEILNGGLGSDSFSLNNLATSSNIRIIGGNDFNNGLPNNRIISDGSNITWSIDGTDQGSLRQAGTLLTEFSEIQSLENLSTTGGETAVFFENSISHITGSINSGISNLTLRGDDISIGRGTANHDIRGATIAGNGTLTIRPDSEATSIELGGVDSQEGMSLAITDGELAAIQRGFSRILIGGENHTGGISLGGDASFQDSVVLRSQASIDTRNGEVSSTHGSLTLQTEASILGNHFSAQEDAVTLMAQQDIVVDSIVSRNGEGITINSNRGSVTVNNTLETADEFLGNNVNILAENSVNLGSINTTGGRRSGDISIESKTGSITTNGITTANGTSNDTPGTRRPGNVTLTSPESIQVDFIDARGNGQNTESSRIDIDTQDNFRAVGAIANSARGRLSEGVSIATLGAQDGNVRIQYGNSNSVAKAFHIGDISDNGLAASLAVPTTTILEGDFFSDYQQGTVELVNRGILPANFSGNRVTLALDVGIVQGIETTETDSEVIFEQIEARNAQAFANYLGIPEDSQIHKQTTLQDVQQALGEIELSTEVTPGLVYVYFVPDAEKEASIGIGQEETISPNDQLEVMLITQEGTPIRRRQWGITRAQVDEANRTLRQQATSQFSTAQQYLPPAQQLYNWIVKPITDTLQQQSINSLGFVMDTGMRTMPIGVLHDGEQYLVENYSLGMLPSFSFSKISTTEADNARINLEETRVLAMGASQFEDKADLPAVEAEITLISEQLWEGDAFLNEEFVLKNLQRQLQKEDYDIIHLATHAVLDSGNLNDSYIQLWDEKLSLNELNKLQLSDEEIKLIILSACNTALGDPSAEYGFAGLAINSGARTALASLWPVNDEGTFAFMSQFYTQLRESSVTAEALQQAQIQLINGEVTIDDGVVYGKNNEEIATLPALEESGRWDFSHPFYWSPFTMIGNPW